MDREPRESSVGRQPCGRSEIGIGSEAGRLDQTWPTGTIRKVGRGGGAPTGDRHARSRGLPGMPAEAEPRLQRGATGPGYEPVVDEELRPLPEEVVV